MVVNDTYVGDKKRNRAVAFPVARDREREKLITISLIRQEYKPSTDRM